MKKMMVRRTIMMITKRRPEMPWTTDFKDWQAAKS